MTWGDWAGDTAAVTGVLGALGGLLVPRIIAWLPEPAEPAADKQPYADDRPQPGPPAPQRAPQRGRRRRRRGGRRLVLGVDLPALPRAWWARRWPSSTGGPGCCPPSWSRRRTSWSGRWCCWPAASSATRRRPAPQPVGVAGRGRRLLAHVADLPPRHGVRRRPAGRGARHRAGLPGVGRAAAGGLRRVPARRRRRHAAEPAAAGGPQGLPVRAVHAAGGVGRGAVRLRRWARSTSAPETWRGRSAPRRETLLPCCVGSLRGSPTDPLWSRSWRDCRRTWRSPPPTSPTRWRAVGSATAAGRG